MYVGRYYRLQQASAGEINKNNKIKEDQDDGEEQQDEVEVVEE